MLQSSRVSAACRAGTAAPHGQASRFEGRRLTHPAPSPSETLTEDMHLSRSTLKTPWLVMYSPRDPCPLPLRAVGGAVDRLRARHGEYEAISPIPVQIACPKIATTSCVRLQLQQHRFGRRRAMAVRVGIVCRARKRSKVACFSGPMNSRRRTVESPASARVRHIGRHADPRAQPRRYGDQFPKLARLFKASCVIFIGRPCWT